MKNRRVFRDLALAYAKNKQYQKAIDNYWKVCICVDVSGCVYVCVCVDGWVETECRGIK